MQAGSRDASRPSSAAGGGGGTTDVGSEIATGTGEGMSRSEYEDLQEDAMSEISDTGWDTDLDIQGKSYYAPIIVTPHHLQHGVGWGITRGFASCLLPEGWGF